ncbi:MAG: hypothetical protein R3E83_19300 [Burkholderiaceae bacterium]
MIHFPTFLPLRPHGGGSVREPAGRQTPSQNEYSDQQMTHDFTRDERISDQDRRAAVRDPNAFVFETLDNSQSRQGDGYACVAVTLIPGQGTEVIAAISGTCGQPACGILNVGMHQGDPYDVPLCRAHLDGILAAMNLSMASFSIEFTPVNSTRDEA